MTPELHQYAQKMGVFLKNREQFPPELLLPYAGKHVAWSPDGTHIVASAAEPGELEPLIRAAGEDPQECVFSYVPDEDSIVLGGLLEVD